MARFRGREEDGFTMIELMVVVLIIAILIGIAIPTFLGMRQRAQDRAAQISVILALKTAKGVAVDDPADSFATVDTAVLNTAEPSVVFVDGGIASASQNQISTTVPDAGAGDQIFVAAVQSASDACFYGRAFSNGGADFARVDGADCTADNHGVAVFGPSW
jgi:type IV pilus assembly protein PilA